ncbi:MAG: hypothetical protein LBU86_02635, partial [Oscillospiraceae bacterium]|nr:hypothetical protein [Oscillospiraceae bacterium]
LILLSLLLNCWNDAGSPENTVGLLNTGMGVAMVLLAAVYLAFQRKKRLRQLKDEEEEKTKTENR